MAETVPSGDLQRYRVRIDRELRESVLPFWMEHSLDRQFGGYLNCLDRDGTCYDTKKHVWLQSRQTWMLSKLYNAKLLGERSGELLDAARLGADFLRKFARFDHRVYFSLTRDGRPHFIQRKLFSECFYVMALAEYSRASGDGTAMQEARALFQHVIEYARNPSLLGRPAFDHLPETSELAVPMILLNLIEELSEPGESTYDELAQWCVDRIRLHVRPDIESVLETVGSKGELLDSPEGRLINPGHAIEAGWFLFSYADRSAEEGLKKTAAQMIEWSFEKGWDEEYGGIYYFLDREGYSPIQLEWSLKLWWPICEAMIAFLMLYRETGDPGHFRRFGQVADYAFEKLADPEYGEWFGYLDRYGNVSQRFKGGPYKGFFHIPRALWMCAALLDEMAGPGNG